MNLGFAHDLDQLDQNFPNRLYGVKFASPVAKFVQLEYPLTPLHQRSTARLKGFFTVISVMPSTALASDA